MCETSVKIEGHYVANNKGPKRKAYKRERGWPWGLSLKHV